MLKTHLEAPRFGREDTSQQGGGTLGVGGRKGRSRGHFRNNHTRGPCSMSRLVWAPGGSPDLAPPPPCAVMHPHTQHTHTHTHSAWSVMSDSL